MAKVKPIPEGYHTVQPYLMMKNSKAAIEFYRKAFSAKERLCMKEPSGRVSHAEIEIGDCCVMMADENPSIEAYSAEHYGGSPVSLQIYVEDCDAVYRKALEMGAKSEREPADQFYGDRSAGVRDPFGYRWYISTDIKDVSMEELEKGK